MQAPDEAQQDDPQAQGSEAYSYIAYPAVSDNGQMSAASTSQDASQGSHHGRAPPPRNPPVAQDWRNYRAVITRYYVTEGRSLREVVQLMKDNYGFRATARMYKARFSEWNLHKNLNSAQFQYIASLLEHYEQLDQSLPTLLINGEPVDLDRVRRYYSERCHDRQVRDAVLARIDNVMGRVDGIDPNSFIDIAHTPESSSPASYGDNTTTTTAQLVLVPSDGHRVQQVLHYANLYSKWCMDLDSSLYDESYEELVQTPLEKGYISRPQPSRKAESQMVWGLFQDGLKMLEAEQTPSAFQSFHQGCELIPANLKAKPNFVLRLVVREFGTPSWRQYEDIRQLLLSYLVKMAIAVLGVEHPLSVVLREFLKAETFEASQELVLTVLADSCRIGLGDRHKEVFRLLRGLSVVQKRQGDIHLSKQTLKAAARASESLNGLKDDQTRRCLSRLANQYADEGRFAESERVYEHVLAGADLINKGLDDITVCTFQNLANVAKKQGNEVKRAFWLAQEDRIRAILAVADATGGDVPMDVASMHLNDMPNTQDVQVEEDWVLPDVEIRNEVHEYLASSSSDETSSSAGALTPSSGEDSSDKEASLVVQSGETAGSLEDRVTHSSGSGELESPVMLQSGEALSSGELGSSDLDFPSDESGSW